MTKIKLKPFIINLSTFVLVIGIYYIYNIQYYIKIDLRSYGFSNLVSRLISEQNKNIITKKIFKNSKFLEIIKVEHTIIDRERIIIFFEKEKHSDLNEFLEEEFNLREVFKFLISNRKDNYNSLKTFLLDIKNPPNAILNEVRTFNNATRELEMLLTEDSVNLKLSEILAKNPSVFDILIFSITYLLISSTIILNYKKIRKFIS
tara:strand:- start:209 stop:820 length:612 start_codon:yes stop_codon:yes gene_type:complete